MPYEIKKDGSKFCVHKKGGAVVPGGCHSTRAAALQHMRALYANVPDASAASVLDTSHLAIVRDVEIMKTGIEYQLSTGKTTFTTAELADVVASQDDPAVVSPRIKIGHTDKRFNGDGEPALGRATNLRLGDEGHTIVGDYVGVPAWLADVMASAYPNRSVEGNWNVETETGKVWKFVVSACSLLGVQWPGISTLDDLPILYSDEGPEGVTVNGEPMDVVLAARAPVQATVNVDDVRQAYYNQRGTTDSFWWIRGMYLDPDELIVDDDQGTLYRIPFDASGDQIDFGDPTPVEMVYKDVEPAMAASVYVQGMSVASGANCLASYQTREESGAAEKGEGMDPEVLKALGLPEDANTAQVLAAVGSLKAETPPSETPPAEGEGEGEGEGTEETHEESTEQTPDNLVELAAKRGLVLVDKDTMDTIKSGAETAQRLAAEAQATKKDQVLAAAMSEGKFPPARKDHWAALYDADPEGTQQTLDALASGIIPVDERGVAPAGEQIDDAYPAEWFPDVAARKAKRQLPGSGSVTNEREVVS
jgi:hypothetical protein